LIIAKGAPQVILGLLAKEYSVRTIICSKTFEPFTEISDAELMNELASSGIHMARHNTRLLADPGELKTKAREAFRVFTPFYKALAAGGFTYVDSLPQPSTQIWPAPTAWPPSLSINDLGLSRTMTSSGKDWAAGFTRFKPGERGALMALHTFLARKLEHYAEGRDRPDLDVTSHLSPHLRFGEISPQRILYELDQAVAAEPRLSWPAGKFRAELAWREFSYGLLQQQPNLHLVNFRRDFDGFPWRDDDAGFRAWCRGETGYELVDAGMRELWRTGYMHNRVRMVAASFFSKHLQIDWRRGEQWFWDCLLDADPASNPAQWQWVAGSGADAAPYFRIFNPLSQAEKFDSEGIYRDRWLDPLRGMTPYPAPIVDHAFARQRALDAYASRRSDADDDAD